MFYRLSDNQNTSKNDQNDILYFLSSFEIVLRKIKVISSPDESQYPFGLGFSPKDMGYSGREVVLEKGRSAPKKKHQPFDQCFVSPLSKF